jgi:hypothetical protein
MQFFKTIFLFFLLTSINFSLFSQDDNCVSSLQKAQKLFNQGMIDEIDEILKPCIENGFTRNQRVEAYKLIILASLLDGDQVQAENTMIDFLKRNPEYEIMPNDPVEFVYLFESFRTLSVFSIGIKIGTNASNPVILEPWSSGDLNSTSLSKKPAMGYQVGLSVNRYIARKIFLNVEANYFSNSYKFIHQHEKLGIFSGVAYETNTFKETIRRYDFPLSVGYEIESYNFNYFIRTGFSYSILTKVSGTPMQELFDSEIRNGATTSLVDFRNRQLFLYHVGAGVKHKIPRGFLAADIRFHTGLNKLNIPEKRMDNHYPPDYKYIDSDFTLNSLTISLGYYFSVYQPKKNQK